MNYHVIAEINWNDSVYDIVLTNGHKFSTNTRNLSIGDKVILEPTWYGFCNVVKLW